VLKCYIPTALVAIGLFCWWHPKNYTQPVEEKLGGYPVVKSMIGTWGCVAVAIILVTVGRVGCRKAG
jgi:hypothetical protein